MGTNTQTSGEKGINSHGIPLDCSCGTQLLRKGSFQFYLGCQYFFKKNTVS